MIETMRIETIERPFDDLSCLPYFKWWAAQTTNEPHMITETPEDLLASALVALFVFNSTNESPIGAAGIFPARTKDGEAIFHQGQLTVEMGSNVVAEPYRCHGVGKTLIEQRIAIAKQRGWLPVSVTSNPIVHRVFEQIGGIAVNGDPEFKSMREGLCLCTDRTPDCKICPMAERGCWVFSQPK